MKLFSKLSLEFAPLVLFFVASAVWDGDFIRPTAVLVVSTAVSLAVMWYFFHQPALMAIINAATGILAGSATLISHEKAYVMMKPTIIGGVYATILMIGLLLNRPLFRTLLGKTLHLTDEGWRVLTWLWFGYFVFISIMNEYVRTHLGFTEWAYFKVFVLVPLTVVYALPQIYLLKRYRTEDAEPLFGSKAIRGAGPSRPDPVAAHQP
jgi:intracellular septation protein